MLVVIRTKLAHNVRTKIAPPVGSAESFLSLLRLAGWLVRWFGWVWHLGRFVLIVVGGIVFDLVLLSLKYLEYYCFSVVVCLSTMIWFVWVLWWLSSGCLSIMTLICLFEYVLQFDLACLSTMTWWEEVWSVGDYWWWHSLICLSNITWFACLGTYDLVWAAWVLQFDLACSNAWVLWFGGILGRIVVCGRLLVVTLLGNLITRPSTLQLPVQHTVHWSWVQWTVMM